MTLPNFVILGAQKSGTTSLYYYLDQHPDVFMSPVKEPHFFNNEGGGRLYDGPYPGPDRRISTVEEYERLFDAATTERAIGEASPSYLYLPEVPARMERHVSEAKLIAVLRDPAERAYSAYLHTVRTGREPLDDFGSALRAEEGRIRENWHHLYHYKARGLYHGQLLRYHEIFGRDNVRVYLYEDLGKNPVSVSQDIFRFLGVDDSFVPDASVRYNASGVPKNRFVSALIKKSGAVAPALKRVVPFGVRQKMKGQMFAKPPPFPEETRGELVEFYREDVSRLQALIGRDLSRWLAPGARDAASRPDSSP